MTIIDVCNIALDRVGQAPISDYLTGTTDTSKQLRRNYPSAARKVLSAQEAEWKEAVFYGTVESEYTTPYTSHASNNTLGLLTFEVQETVALDVPQKGNLSITIDGTAYSHDYTSWTTKTFTLKVGLEATCDGSDTATTTPNNHDDDYEYMYSLPTNCIRMISIENNPVYEFIVEGLGTGGLGGYLFTNEYDADYGIRLRYIKDIRDEVSSVVVYGEHIADAIAAELAWRLSPRKNARLLGELRGEAVMALEDAMAEDAEARQASSPEELGSKYWHEVK